MKCIKKILKYIKEKILKWIKDKYNSGIVWKVIITLFIIFLPLIIITIYTHIMYAASNHIWFLSNWSTGSTDGWLGLIGAYFGAIIGIYGVYWSVVKTNDIEEERLKLQERPTILVSRYTENFKGFFYFSFNKNKESIVEIGQNIKRISETYELPFMVFRNCSSKNAINCLIHIKYRNSAEDYFLVENIKPFSEVKILRSDAYYCGLKKIKKVDKDLGDMIDINLKYLTESNEVVRVNYIRSGNNFVPNKPEYIKDYNYLDDYYSSTYTTGKIKF